MKHFKKYTIDNGDALGQMHSEALFLGSVMHSIDHHFLEICILDTAWFDVDTEMFEPMKYISRVVRAGFVEALPCVIPAYKLVDAPHPFYKGICKEIVGNPEIDQDLVRETECCILR